MNTKTWGVEFYLLKKTWHLKRKTKEIWTNLKLINFLQKNIFLFFFQVFIEKKRENLYNVSDCEIKFCK